MTLYFVLLWMAVAAADKFKLVQDEIRIHRTQVDECGENEDYTSCGSTCFPTCFLDYYPQPCVRMCIPGCYCKTGFVQSRNGSCIRPRDCPREAADTLFDRNCFDEPEGGRCSADIPMWYFDREVGFCSQFYYGGCGGNGNRYPSEEECLEDCRGELFQKEQCGVNSRYNGCGTPCPVTCENYANPPEYCVMMCNPGCQCDEGYVQKEDGSCVLPENCPRKADEKNCVDSPEVGPCRAIVPKWYYNRQNSTCRQFLYGGCEGNGNKYSSEDECLQYCGAEICRENEHFESCGTACPLTCDNYRNPPNHCVYMCVIGCHCDAGYVKTNNGTCVSPQDCPKIQKNCVEEPETGPCRALFYQWYFDQETGTCREFVYGGCQGNGNRYLTEEECLENCVEGEEK